MENQMRQRFFDLPIDKPELPEDQRSLYLALASDLVYIPVMNLLIGLGILAIAVFSIAGLFDTKEYLLFAVAGVNILNSGLHLLLYRPLRQGELGAVAILVGVISGTFAAVQVAFWQDVIWFPLITVFLAFIPFVIARGTSLRVKLTILVIGILLILAVIYSNTQISYPRLSVTHAANIAALAIYLLFTLAMIILSVMNGMINFRAVSSRLVTILTTASIFSFIVMISAGMFSNSINIQKQTFQQLEAVTSLKTSQVKSVLTRLQNQANQPLNNPVSAQRIRYLLTGKPSDLAYSINFDLQRSYLSNLQASIPNSEFLILNADGRVLLSTNSDNQNSNFSQNAFIVAAKKNLPFGIENNFPGTQNQTSLLIFSPIIEKKVFAGMVVLRTDFGQIETILESTPKTNTALETYLITTIDGKIVPITKTRANITEITTYPAQQAFNQEISQGSSSYTNYAGVDVLGNFVWIPELQSALVSEIKTQEVSRIGNQAFLVNIAVAVLMILLLVIVAFFTSRSISRPLQNLTEKAATLAGGELQTRITMSRLDEIGTLASSFNTMASEMQTVVRTLEMKVEDRTHDLQKQANYLRIASEVARDITTAQTLDELLNRAAQLILARFGFYHTGIFLIDNEREYAILRASPTEAGREMLMRGHRLKLGQVGIVGYVAATGTPRIVLDTGQDSAFFNNPLLPQTRSEIAIPLKLNELVIGVLDVQSNQSEAFTQDDISTLQILADQLALAIQRVELVSNMQRNFEELENTYKAFTSESWQKFSQEADFTAGYVFNGVKITPLTSIPVDKRNILGRGQLVTTQEGDGTTVLAPLKLRDQVIGAITLRFHSSTIDPDTAGLIEDTAARLAIALENARLYAETQRLVQRERAISEISNRISTSFNIENILRTTVMEIGKMVPDSEVIVQLEQNKE
jgi:GAF domain-containing protein/HAMP domain-containing protein